LISQKLLSKNCESDFTRKQKKELEMLSEVILSKDQNIQKLTELLNEECPEEEEDEEDDEDYQANE
jgi:hypothetical protein